MAKAKSKVRTSIEHGDFTIYLNTDGTIVVSANLVGNRKKGEYPAYLERSKDGETNAWIKFRRHAEGYDPASHLDDDCQIGGCVGCETKAYRAASMFIYDKGPGPR